MAFKIPNFYAQHKKGAFAKGPEASNVPSPLNVSYKAAYEAQSDEKKSKQSEADFTKAAEDYNMKNYGTKSPSKGIDDDFKSKAKTEKLKSEKEEYKKKREVTAAEKAKKASETKTAEPTKTDEDKKVVPKNKRKARRLERIEKRKAKKKGIQEVKDSGLKGKAKREAKRAVRDKVGKTKVGKFLKKGKDKVVGDALGNEVKKDSPAKMTSPLNKGKTDYTLHGKPLTEAQTGYDPKQLISDQSLAADKKARIKYDAEQKKKDQAKPKPKPTPKPKNKRAQAVLDARKAKEPKNKKNPSSKELIAARNKRIAEQKAKKDSPAKIKKSNNAIKNNPPGTFRNRKEGESHLSYKSKKADAKRKFEKINKS